MSLFVNGVSCSAVVRTESPQTAVFALLASLPPGRSRGGYEAITVTDAGESLTVLLRCAVFRSRQRDPDLVLGLDWKASMRESLLSMGWSLPAGSDPFQFYLGAGTSFLFLFLFS